MDQAKRERLQAAGFEVHDDPSAIFGLTKEEMGEIDRAVLEALAEKKRGGVCTHPLVSGTGVRGRTPENHQANPSVSTGAAEGAKANSSGSGTA